MHIDPSGRGKDETAFVVTKMLKGIIYVPKWGGFKGGYSESTLIALAEIAKEYGVNEIHYEANFGDGMFGALFSPILARIHPCALLEYKAKGRKELRIIDTLEPVLNQHRLVIDRKVIQQDHDLTVNEHWYSGIYQLSHITRDPNSLKHDDRVDVLAAGVGYWTQMIQNDTAKAEQEHRDKLMQIELRKFMKNVVGATPKRRTWAGI